MFSLPLRVLVCLFMLVGAARAQSVVEVDPGFLPMDLRQTAVEECGVSVAADPTWRRAPVREVSATGKDVRGVKFEVNRDYWKAQGKGPWDFIVNPYFSVSVTCFPSTLTETGKVDGLKNFADRVHASAKARPNTKPKRLKTFKAEGLGTVYEMHTVVTGKTEARWGAIDDLINFYTLHRGQLVTIRVFVPRKPPAAYVVDLRKGAEVTRTYKSGEVLTFRLSAPAVQNILGTEIAAARSARSNAALFKTFAASLRGF
ncbi:hypothetical protein [uncultured Tateyamaria sp.]|uniref:hypothetical protein n=1 Tax=uncultured Tateyamaria sp. TaxID=455651 RepID=UPI00261D40A9|nr:hypothetical protein [uncultured Tateyamaria sp.]